MIRRALLPIVLAAGLAAAGCAHVPPPVTVAPGTRPMLVVLPLENLSGHSEYGARFTRLVWTTLGRTGRFAMVDPGEVDAMLVELRIRSAGSLTREQLERASTRTGARWLLAGTLLECGTARTPDGEVPTFSLSLRLIDGPTGEVVWTDLSARSGEDRETIFGWGREVSLDKLAETATRQLVDRLTLPTTPERSNPKDKS